MINVLIVTEATITTVQTDTETADPTEEITTLAQGNKVVEVRNRDFINAKKSDIKLLLSFFIL